MPSPIVSVFAPAAVPDNLATYPAGGAQSSPPPLARLLKVYSSNVTAAATPPIDDSAARPAVASDESVVDSVHPPGSAVPSCQIFACSVVPCARKRRLKNVFAADVYVVEVRLVSTLLTIFEIDNAPDACTHTK